MWNFIAFVGFATILIGVVAVVRPLPKLYLPTRLRAAAAVFVGFVLLSVGAVQDQAAKSVGSSEQQEQQQSVVAPVESRGSAAVPPSSAAQARREPEWTEVTSWRGNGIKETEGFNVASREWRIRWKSDNEPFANAGILQIFVHRDDGAMVNLVANRQGPGEDVSYVRAAPGRYYLAINSANIGWDVTVEDQR